MTDEEAMRAALAGAPVRPLWATLVRCVALLPLTAGGTPDYLFTSGRANRCNPAGMAGIYFSEDERTARAEYGRRLGRGTGALQSVSIYFAEVELARVLDLEDEPTRNALNLKPRDLTVRWQFAQKPTQTQLVGLAVSQQQAIAAIRFPSDAARAAGFVGFNVAIFCDCVRRPDSVRILGPTKKPLQKWP
jgi:RES domain-containing protein